MSIIRQYRFYIIFILATNNNYFNDGHLKISNT